MRIKLLVFAGMAISALAVCARANETQTENASTGTTSWQLTNPALNREIEGYASATSVNAGGSISFFVSTSDSLYTMDFYRIGWYGGAGGREVLGPISRQGGLQSTPTANDFGTFECNWTNPYVLNVSATWTSGIYLVKLTGSSSGKQSYIQFVVREDSRNSAYLFQRSITTDQAYNNWPGPAANGKSLYTFNSSGNVAAVKVSFNRPYFIDSDSHNYSQVGAGFFLRWEINMARWMEKNGYDVTYCTNIDVHENPNLLLTHKAFLSVGHDEYWSWQMRENVEVARDAGVGLGFFAADVSYWQIRLEGSPVTGQADRTQVAYKSSASSDPTTDVCHLTTWWRNNSCKPSEQALVGAEYTAYNVGCPSNSSCADVVIADASNWALAGTGLVNGSHIPGVLGYEVDGLVQSDSPPGTALIAHSPIGTGAIQDASPAPAYAYSDIVTYTAATGATVFSVGTIQWSWALDDWGGGTQRPSMLNAAAQQITLNVLARLVTLVAPNTSGPVTDDFVGTVLNASVWTFVNPLNDATVSVAGSEAVINVPGGSTHDPWSVTNTAVRIMQPVSNTNFEVVAKFDSPVAASNQNQGILVQQDAGNFLRFEAYYAGGVRLFSGSMLNGTPAVWLNTSVAATFPIWLKVNRTGATWTYSWSENGTTYGTVLVQSQAIVANSMGVFAANCCSPSSPAFTSRVGFFLNTSDSYNSSPITPGSVTVTQTSATVTWTTLLPMTSQIDYGTSATYSSQTTADLTLITSHSQTVSGLACATTYHYQITSANLGTDETPSSMAKSNDATLTTASCSGGGGGGSGNSGAPSSDDFTGTSLNTALWTFVNPLNDSGVSVNGNSEAAITVPSSSTHDPWSGSGDTAPRIMQTISNGDFEVVAKFDSRTSSNNQNEGIIVQQDAANFVRFEVYYASSGTRLFSGTSINNINTVQLNNAISPTWPIWLKVNRTGNVWTFSWSNNGSTFTSASTYSQSLVVSGIGLFAANCCATSAPLFTALIDYFFNTASQLGPTITGVGATATTNTATVTWSTNEASNSQVAYGLSPSFGLVASNASMVTMHSVLLSGLSCNTSYYYQVSSTDSSQNTANIGVFTFTTTACSGSGGGAPVSDNFDNPALNTSLWTFVNPLSDGSLSVNGSEAVINVPGGSTHDPWPSTDTSIRLMQAVSNVNFEVVAKFDSQVAANNQNQGILVEQDVSNFLRFEVFDAGGGTRLFSGSLLSGSAVVWLNTAVPATFPVWLKVNRNGTTWTYSWSKDGNNYTTALVQNQALSTTNIGVFAANCCSPSAPPFTMKINYFINTASPLAP